MNIDCIIIFRGKLFHFQSVSCVLTWMMTPSLGLFSPPFHCAVFFLLCLLGTSHVRGRFVLGVSLPFFWTGYLRSLVEISWNFPETFAMNSREHWLDFGGQRPKSLWPHAHSILFDIISLECFWRASSNVAYIFTGPKDKLMTLSPCQCWAEV